MVDIRLPDGFLTVKRFSEIPDPVILNPMSDKDHKPSTGMVIDGIATAELLDSSAERLKIAGASIDSFLDGTAPINYEHRSAEDATIPAEEIVGTVVTAKKIYKESDCDNDRQRMYWNQVQVPYIYLIGRLYDGAGHPGAKNLAAIIRDAHANGDKLTIGWSIEGSTLERKDNELVATVARRIALTLKPCLKAAKMGLLSDPNAPEGFDKEASKVDVAGLVSKDEGGLYMRLGGYTSNVSATDLLDLNKTMTAGMPSGAPSSLTGGAALQVEDRGRKHKAMAMAALRDWPKTGKFRDYLKAQLPEASDDFLDHFTDIVDHHQIKLAKAQEAIEDLKAAGREIKEPKTPKASKKVVSNPNEPAVPPLTIMGKPVKPNPELKGPHFDEQGTLHTKLGSFPMYIPQGDELKSFLEIAHKPDIEQFHGYATREWMKVHNLMKAGKLPPEVIHHAMTFSAFSPNKAVPVQELMYGHFNDASRATGYNFLSHPDEIQALRTDYLNRDHPARWPALSPEHWRRLDVPHQDEEGNWVPGALRMLNDSPPGSERDRKVGEIKPFSLGEQHFDVMGDHYAKLHPVLTELFNRHRGDSRAIADELIRMKVNEGQINDRAKRQNKKGVNEPMYSGPSLYGFKPKTIRYAISMAGGGRTIVFDTHMIRGLFGLHRKLDGATIEHLKQQLWSPGYHHISGAIDQYYAKHHPAVQVMLQHPEFGPQFEHPEDAIFPAFWRHWMTIVPHENSRGIPTTGSNMLTDHKPFFESIQDMVKSMPEHDEGVHHAMRTAHQHLSWVEQHGLVAASMLYARFLLPQLLASAARRTGQSLVLKAQSLSVDLRKAAPDIDFTDAQVPDPDTNRPIVQYKGRLVRIGKIKTPAGGSRYLLEASPTHFTTVPGPKGPLEAIGNHTDGSDIVKPWWKPNTMKLIYRHAGSRDTMDGTPVTAYPESVDSPSTVDAAKHGVGDYLHHDDIKDMVDGFEFDQPHKWSDIGIQKDFSWWGKTKDGRPVYVKRAPEETTLNAARKEGLAYNLSRDFFGMDQYFPKTAIVRHPKDGSEWAIIEGHVGQHMNHKGLAGDKDKTERAQKMLHPLKSIAASGDLDKLAMMNYIWSNADRHHRNFMFTPDGSGLKLIDHGHAFHGDSVSQYYNTSGRGAGFAGYWDDSQWVHGDNDDHDPEIQHFHPDAIAWVNKLNPHELNAQLVRHDVPDHVRETMVEKLKSLQFQTNHDPNRPKLHLLKEAEDNSGGHFLGDKTTPAGVNPVGAPPPPQVPNAPHPHDNQMWVENLAPSALPKTKKSEGEQ